MRLGDVKVGDKFNLVNATDPNRMYLKIDMNTAIMFATPSLHNLVCALDLTTYKVVCFNPEYAVEVEYDNVFI